MDHSFRRLSSFLFLTLSTIALSCGGGGGCSSCGGAIAPVPHGFPLSERIAHAAQVRVTESGIGFLESNAASVVSTFAPGGLDFPIPPQEVSFGVTLRICERNDCMAHLEVAGLELEPVGPNRIVVHLRIILDSRDTSGARRPLPTNIGCQIDLDTRRGSREHVGFVANVDFLVETQPARAGYTKISLSDASLAPGENVENDDIRISGGLLGACRVIDLDLIKSFVISALEGQVSSLLDGAVGDQLCTKRGTTGCPTGTFPRPSDTEDAICRFADNNDAECVSSLLGFDGRGDFGQAFLGGFSPGVHGPAQFLLAGAGEGEARNNGLSLSFYGGFMSMDRAFTTSPGHNSCVPAVDPPPIPTILRVDSFRGNTIPGTSTATHVGIGIAEDYLNYAGYGMFDSGMFCLGVGTRLSQQVSTGLFSLLIRSLGSLSFPQTNAPISIAVRPQRPPQFEIGAGSASDPLLAITFPQLSLDFYVWSTERYVRFMTFTADITATANLTVEDGKLVPHIVGITTQNAVVTNSEALSEDPDVLASTVDTVLGAAARMLGGAISPIALPDIMGFQLEVPSEGIRGVTDGSDEFLGVFANLHIAPTTGPLVRMADTQLSLGTLRVNPESLTLGHLGQGPVPSLPIDLAASDVDASNVEFSYRIDGGDWSPWSRDAHPLVTDRIFFLQARHVLEARARTVGAPASVDATPARAEVLVDVLAPQVELAQVEGFVRVNASDVLTPKERLRYRHRAEGGAWSSWSDKAEAPATGRGIEVEVRDEAGNVGSAHLALIRGIPNPASTSGCGCSVPGADGGNTSSRALGLSLFALIAGVLAWRRRSIRVAHLSRVAATVVALASLPLVLGVAGCDCGGGSDPMVTPPGPCNDACNFEPGGSTGTLCCMSSNMCVAWDLETLCESGFVCANAAAVTLDGTCQPTCSMCMRRPPLDPGQNATYLDMVVTPAGQATVVGYNAGVTPPPGSGRLYGDFVAGNVDMSSGRVTWEIVDGVPTGPVSGDPDGWRDGIGAPGDDVGRFASAVLSGTDVLATYYDATHGALKFARRTGTTWSTYVLDNTGDSGRYSSLALTASGAPAVAYMRIEPSTATPGRLKASVRVATATSANPTHDVDWTSAEVASVEMPCRPSLCAMGEVCLENGSCVTPSAASACPMACGTGEACVAGTCQAKLPDPYVEDLLPATGLYNALASGPSGLGLVFYDRSAGKLMMASERGGIWAAPVVVDGYGVPTAGNGGDSGIGASLAIDAMGNWHVSYVDGTEEALKYARIGTDGTVAAREVVDDGSVPETGMPRHSDGRHVVGDDSSIAVLPTGEIRIVYQDATSHRAVMATRAAMGSTWSVRVLDHEQLTGYWLEQVLVGTQSYVATFWRNDAATARADRFGVRVLVTP